MEFLIGCFVAVGTFIASILAHVLAHDFCETAPKLCQRLIRCAASFLPEADRARYTEEWLADLNERVGVLEKFRHALSCFRGARRLKTSGSFTKPTFTSLRFGFEGLGFVDLNYATSIVIFEFITAVMDDMARISKARDSKKSPFSIWSPHGQLFLMRTIKTLLTAAYRNRKHGKVDLKKLLPICNLLNQAIDTHNANFTLFRDGNKFENSNLSAFLDRIKSRKDASQPTTITPKS